MEVVDCLFCGSSEREVQFRGRDLIYGVPGEFTMMRCRGCGFLYLSPRPDADEIGAYYPDTYALYAVDGQSDASSFARAMQRDDMERRCRLILRHRSRGDLLDVGAASGNFLAAMQAHGWKVRGLEPSATAVERARAAHGLPMDQGTLGTVEYPAESFDVVTMWEVIEHVPDPRRTLSQIHCVLRPGGYLVMSLPNRTALDARVFGRGWTGYDVPRHFSVFSPNQITRAVMDAGFEEPAVFAPPGRLGAVHGGFIFIATSLLLRLRAGNPPGRQRAFAERAVVWSLSRPPLVVLLFLASLPYQWTARATNRATTMVVVARKG